jgi:hypothetical protein
MGALLLIRQSMQYITELSDLNICSTVVSKKILTCNRIWEVMRLSKASSPLFILFVVLVPALVSQAYASVESVSVKPGDEFVRGLQVANSDVVSLTFNVLGSDPSSLHFSVLFPNGTSVDFGAKSQGLFSFHIDADGKCLLIFENGESSDAQQLTLDYSVEHYVFGLPMLVFVLLAVAVLLVFVIAGYMVMGKYGA